MIKIKTLRARFTAISCILITFIVSSLIISQLVSNNTHDTIEDLQRGSQIIQRHMEADMMHDAIRGDVISAILAHKNGDNSALINSEKDFAEHVKNFEAMLNANMAESLPENLRKEFIKADIALKSYSNAGSALNNCNREKSTS